MHMHWWEIKNGGYSWMDGNRPGAPPFIIIRYRQRHSCFDANEPYLLTVPGKEKKSK